MKFLGAPPYTCVLQAEPAQVHPLRGVFTDMGRGNVVLFWPATGRAESDGITLQLFLTGTCIGRNEQIMPT